MSSHCRMALSLVIVLATIVSAVPGWGANADWGFEFNHKPALDGAGYLIQPLNNIRASGNMAIEVGETLDLPGFPSVDGQGINNGDGTFSYDAADDGSASAAMGFIQGSGAGGSGDPALPSPLVNQRNYTLEARFKVQGVEIDDGQPRYRFFDLENNALGSLHFAVSYGRLPGGLSISVPVAPQFATSQDIPIVQDEFLTLRVVTTSLPGPANTGKVETFIKLSDASDWSIGPMIQTTWSTTRNRGSLAIACAENCGSETGKLTVDYIRGISRSLALTESLEAKGANPIAGDFDGNGRVDGADKTRFDTDFGTSLNGGDFLNWQRNFGVSAGASASAVPEASALGLAACCLASLATRRRQA